MSDSGIQRSQVIGQDAIDCIIPLLVDPDFSAAECRKILKRLCGFPEESAWFYASITWSYEAMRKLVFHVTYNMRADVLLDMGMEFLGDEEEGHPFLLQTRRYPNEPYDGLRPLTSAAMRACDACTYDDDAAMAEREERRKMMDSKFDAFLETILGRATFDTGARCDGETINVALRGGLLKSACRLIEHRASRDPGGMSRARALQLLEAGMQTSSEAYACVRCTLHKVLEEGVDVFQNDDLRDDLTASDEEEILTSSCLASSCDEYSSGCSYENSSDCEMNSLPYSSPSNTEVDSDDDSSMSREMYSACSCPLGEKRKGLYPEESDKKPSKKSRFDTPSVSSKGDDIPMPTVASSLVEMFDRYCGLSTLSRSS